MGRLGGGGARSIFAEPPGSPSSQGGFRVVATAAMWPELGGNSLLLSTLQRSRHSRERSSDAFESCSVLHEVKRNTLSKLQVQITLVFDQANRFRTDELICCRKSSLQYKPLQLFSKNVRATGVSHPAC